MRVTRSKEPAGRNGTLRVGTDCSGIEAPIQALKRLKVDFTHEWACEIDPYAKRSLLANYEPKLFFDDITKKRRLPDIDLYVCGFPCQAFSYAGKCLGMKDARGTIFYECLKVIKKKRPKYFVLENVKGLLHNNKGETFKVIMGLLKRLKTYNVYYKLLNTRHYGIPQNRERVYIVGIKKELDHGFTWPKPRKMKPLKEFIQREIKGNSKPPKCCRESIKRARGIFLDVAWINLNKNTRAFEHFSPTLLASTMLWCKPMKRKATIEECLRLQGFPKRFKQVVSDTQMKKQIGNSMSVNVLVHIFRALFKATNAT